jgi:hypothetical protein
VLFLCETRRSHEVKAESSPVSPWLVHSDSLSTSSELVENGAMQSNLILKWAISHIMLAQRIVLSVLDLRQSARSWISFFSVFRNRNFDILFMSINWIFQPLLKKFRNVRSRKAQNASTFPDHTIHAEMADRLLESISTVSIDHFPHHGRRS